jgi:hypothetical protein
MLDAAEEKLELLRMRESVMRQQQLEKRKSTLADEGGPCPLPRDANV